MGQRYAADPLFWVDQHRDRNEAVQSGRTEILPPNEANALRKPANNALASLKQQN